MSFEGVCVNYRNPGPRRGETRVGSGPDVAETGETVETVDPLDPLQNSVRLSNTDFYNDFSSILRIFHTFSINLTRPQPINHIIKTMP